jgi:alpha-L-fucosidase
MMQPWFPDAKLGIFIHWGIYAVEGTAESWAIFSKERTYDSYMNQRHGFTAANYDPRAWAELFRRAGARYAVLTSKHHDGMALWDTQASDLSVVKQTPAGRDLIAPYAQAMREAGLKVGLYFSHLDWSHPDYAPLPPAERTKDNFPMPLTDHSDDPYHRFWSELGPNTPAWKRFLAFREAQLRELCTNYGEINILWFDGEWTPDDGAYWQMADLRDKLHAWQPNIILNSRMRGLGDFKTPEQGIPIERPEGVWEFNTTINDSWGYKPNDHNYKSVPQLVRMFAECIGMGGNMLLDVGPMADGTIPPEQIERLEGLGAWINRHAEAVYETQAGLPHAYHYGASTLSKDQQTLYLICFDRPSGQVAVKGIRNDIKSISIQGESMTFRKLGGAPWINLPGVLWIDVPESALDSIATVIKIELEGPLDLFTGKAHV